MPDNNEQQQATPVVAIGASAGGLEQISSLVGALTAHTGAAFVIVQHLDPHHDSHLPDLLSRTTSLAVTAIENDMPIEPDRVYVLPAGHALDIDNAQFKLTANTAHEAIPTLIDRFLRALADARGDQATGIILSGTGSDGALGVKAIRAAGGLALVQDPDTAEYDGMPRAAAAHVPSDCILDTAGIADKLDKHLRYNTINVAQRAGPVAGAAQYPIDASGDIQPVDDAALDAILETLRDQGRHDDFRHHKTGMVKRRIRRRMALAGIAGTADYRQLLEQSEAERRHLRNDFLISVTDFFREPASYRVLAHEALDRLLADRDADMPLRVWVPGCATGEEAYSIAMLVSERIQASGRECGFTVFATDVDTAALETARRGLYPESIETDVSAERLRTFFDQTDDHYQITRRLRERVVFAPQSVIADPPYSRLDLISCRNLMIYLNARTQQRLLGLFHFALSDPGFLFLGSSESIGDAADLFEPVSGEHRLYRRLGAGHRRRVEFPVAPGTSTHRHQDIRPAAPAPDKPEKLEVIARDILLAEHVPATLLVNRNLEVLCAYGPTRDYLSLPLGESSLDLMAMVHDDYRSPLRAVLHKALRQDQPHSATTRVRRNGPQTLTITAQPLNRPAAARGLFLVLFEHQEAKAPAHTQRQDGESDTEQQLADELDATRRELHSTIAALESANEELRGSNEEILSMNEELQSSNEELETSKEELQSLNEELTTVNSELENKIDELETTQDDLRNLFAGNEIATVFLDRALRIKQYTPAVRGLINLIASDVGRPLRDMTLNFTDNTLMADIEAVLTDLTAREQEVRTDAGRWYLRRVLPYRTRADVIEGLVITFADITPLKQAALESQAQEQRLDLALSAIDGGMWDMPIDPDAPDTLPDRIYLSDRLKQLLGFEPDQLPDSLRAWTERILPEDRDAFDNVLRRREDAPTSGVHYRIRHRDGHLRWFASHGTVIRDPDDDGEARWIGIDRDITPYKRSDFEARTHRARLQLLADALPVMVVYGHDHGAIEFINTPGRDWFGLHNDTLADNDAAATLSARASRPEQARARIQHCIDTALEGRTSNATLALRHCDGGLRDVRLHAVAHHRESEIPGFFLILVDTTRGPTGRIDAAAQEHRLIDLHRMATLGELASSLAHDLNQPLSAINNYAATLTRMLHDGKPADETTPIPRKIADQVQRASAIVADTRAFVGRRASSYDAVDLNAAVRRTLTLVEARARELDVQIYTELLTPMPDVMGDTVQIEQVLVNIVTNAFEAMQDIERERSLWLTSEKPDPEHIQIVITDTGDGITADNIGVIFESFHTSKLEGLGMGLAIARLVVEAHGGRLWAESGRGRGASFYIRLPIADPARDAA